MTHIIAALAAIGIATGLTLFIRNYDKKGKDISRITKPLSLIMVALTFASYIFKSTSIYYIRGLNSPLSPFSTSLETGLAVVLVWFGFASMLAIAMGEFWNSKTLRAITELFALPLFLVILIFFKTWGVASLGIHDGTILSKLTSYSLISWRLWLIVAECGIGIAIPLSHVLHDKKLTVPKGKGEIFNFLYALFFAILTIMPCYVPQAFFVSANPQIRLYGYTEAHRIILYFGLIIPYVIFHLLKNKSYDTKRYILIYMSLGLLWIYMGRWDFEMLQSPLSWPLHLCNTAMFLVPLCLIFRMRRLFNFCLFINVMGALLAMVAAGDLDGLNAIGTERISYWVNHYAAFFMPLVILALKIFRRPKFREWVYAVIALTVYFVAMLIVNAWFSNYGECDYFYLNSDFITDKLGDWAEKTRNLVVSFKINNLTFTFYPLYQALFYVVYVGFTVGIWFIYALLFSSWDEAEERRLKEKEMRKMKKELNEFLGDARYAPITGDDTPRLVLRNFSKRYGTNKHYSVNDVSLEVKGGEIFGFLGPNGAGKSTIIKSMVGIQTITSGAIEICGYDVEKQSAMSKFHLGFVPDHYALYENLTGREYINYIADLYSVTKEYRDEVIEKLVNRFQLVGSFDNQMKTYSHGMKQKITIMAALVHNPKVWILDEPLTGLDPNSIFEVKECMKEHAAAGNVVFFSSHIIDLVEKLCDRIAIIKKGKLRAVKTIEELSAEGIDLEQYYLSIINDSDDEHAPYVDDDIKSIAEANAI